MNMNRVKRFFSDYGLALLAAFILGGEYVLDWSGLHIENGFSWAFAIFSILLIFQTIKPRIELNKFLNSRPSIIMKRAYPKKNVLTTDFIITNPFTGVITDRYSGGTVSPSEYKPAFRSKFGTTDNSDVESTEQTYVLVEFKNNPQRRLEIHDAIDVIATINYYNDKGNNILGKEIKGLWSGVEPSRLIRPKEDYEFTQITIPANGDERILCIGVKNRDDENCFAYTLESYKGVEFLRSEALNLSVGLIRVEIILSGRNLDDSPFSFRLVNPGKGRDITIAEIEHGSNTAT